MRENDIVSPEPATPGDVTTAAGEGLDAVFSASKAETPLAGQRAA
jgi:hypothetical protein